MPLNLNSQDTQVYEALQLGFRVEKAGAASIASGETTIFNITGRVMVRQIVGEVTTEIQGAATNLKLIYDPTATGADTDIAADLEINGDTVGTHYGITGTIADAVIQGVQQVKAQVAPLILEAGAIHQNSSAARTGVIKWTIWYVPLSDGAVIAAA